MTIERNVEGAIRLLLLLLVLSSSMILLAPLQWLARRAELRIARLLPMFFCRTLCGCLNVRVAWHGALPDRAALVVANHVSWLDILVVGCAQPLAFIAKREVGSWPIIGALARLQGAVFIDRGRRRGVREANRRIAERLIAGQSVVLFAEGTTGCGSRLKRFYTSHFEAPLDALRLAPELGAVPVQPVSIAYTRRNGLPLGRRHRPSVAWYGDMTLLPHLWGRLTGGPLDCDLHIAEPILVTADSNRKAVGGMAERVVREATAAALSGRVRADPPARSAGRPVLFAAERS